MNAKKILFYAVMFGLLAACSRPYQEIRDLQNKLSVAETAAELSAQNTRNLENMYSDIYFELNSLTIKNFKEMVAKGHTVYAYIGRPSCGDCNAFEPMLKRYIRQRKLSNKIYFINVHRLYQNKTEWDAFKMQYGLKGTPVLAKYNRGRLINKLDFEENGGIRADDLEQWLDKNNM